MYFVFDEFGSSKDMSKSYIDELRTERVSSGEDTLCASLITVNLAEANEGTKLDLTIQVASLVGEEMITGNRGGWSAALDNLQEYLTK